jgi:hypothetical protein
VWKVYLFILTLSRLPYSRTWDFVGRVLGGEGEREREREREGTSTKGEEAVREKHEKCGQGQALQILSTIAQIKYLKMLLLLRQ